MSNGLDQALYLFRPELLLTFYGFFLLILGAFPVYRRWIGTLAGLGCVLTLGVVLSFPIQQGLDVFRSVNLFFFNQQLVLDGMALFFKVVFLASAILSILISLKYL